GDTGVAHLATALGTPVVALFGPTDPALSAPRGRAVALTHPVPCAPCFYRVCPIEHPCLRGLEAKRVRDDVLALLESAPPPRPAPLQIARDAVRLRRVAREQAVDVLHAHHSHDHWLALLARPRSGGRRPPVARTFHALRAVKRDAVSRRLYRRTDAALAVSRQIEARCREAGVPPERVYWTPGMADLPRFAAEADGRAVREEFALGDAPVVVSVARLAPNRGHELLLAGFRGLLGARPGR